MRKVSKFKFRFYLTYGSGNHTSFTYRGDNLQIAENKFKARTPGHHGKWVRDGRRYIQREVTK